ncbi:hypothetical protein [Streptomyces sp. NPDC056165]
MTDARDTELAQVLGVVVDTDRGEDPLAWSELPPPAPLRPAETEDRVC